MNKYESKAKRIYLAVNLKSLIPIDEIQARSSER